MVGDDAAAPWWRVVATVPEARADVLADLLWQAGAAGLEERDASGSSVALLAGFADRAAATDAADRLAAEGVETAVEPVDPAEGLDAWRPWARVERAGRWWIAPAWTTPPAEAPAGDLLLVDPGHAFGSGSHPTTRIVLALVDDLVAPGDRVLDVGTGSGVLAVGAARRGATVTAIDPDPASPPAAAANAARNGVDARVQASSTPLAAIVGGGEQYDLVLANLLAPVIAELADDLVAGTRPGGRLVVSGLLADRWQGSIDRLAPLGTERVVEDAGWVAVVLRRPAPPRGTGPEPASGLHPDRNVA